MHWEKPALPNWRWFVPTSSFSLSLALSYPLFITIFITLSLTLSFTISPLPSLSHPLSITVSLTLSLLPSLHLVDGTLLFTIRTSRVWKLNCGWFELWVYMCTMLILSHWFINLFIHCVHVICFQILLSIICIATSSEWHKSFYPPPPITNYIAVLSLYCSDEEGNTQSSLSILLL